jgi:hypothetical protein
MGASPAPISTTPWTENAPTNPATLMVAMWTVALRPEVGLPFERHRARHGGNNRKPMLGSPLPSMRQHHDKASSSVCSPTAYTAVVRARSQGGEDPDGGLSLHSSSGKRGGSPCQP